MRVLRVGYVGVRTGELDRMTWFFRDVLGLEAAGEDATVSFQRLPTHRFDLVEVYGPEHPDERMIPAGVDFMVSFVVEDVEEALADVRAAGLEVVRDLVWAAEEFGNPDYAGFGWFFARAPDGRVYAFQQQPAG